MDTHRLLSEIQFGHQGTEGIVVLNLTEKGNDGVSSSENSSVRTMCYHGLDLSKTNCLSNIHTTSSLCYSTLEIYSINTRAYIYF